MLITVGVVFLFVDRALTDFVYEQKFPDSVQKCFDKAKTEPVSMERARDACISNFYASVLQPQILTKGDNEFFQKRIDSRFGLVPPKTGFRRRREIRTLTAEERQRLVSVLHTMYREGTLHRFGRLHGQTKKKVHKGAAFLPWHRVFILDFEEEMRRIDDRVFLPYWDYTMDNNITRPSDSVVWSDCFFGNGEGYISSGPFRNWYGGHGIPMKRDYARGGQCPPRLINKLDIKGILQKCHFKDVTTGGGPYFKNVYNVEMLHDGVHDWVGGDMDELPFAGFDPIFYMHHAFIDYIWETFRKHQQKNCNIDPETDWRPENDLCQKDREDHGPEDTMFSYTHLRNINGCWANWTKVFYDYEEQPKCPTCGHSEYLYCDTASEPSFPEGICLTKTKDTCITNETVFTNGINYDAHTIFSLYPTVPYIGVFKGMAGDGRSRDMSYTESNKVLQAEIAKGIPKTLSGKVIVRVNNSFLSHYAIKDPNGDTDGQEYTLSLKECTSGCIGLTVIGLAAIGLLIFTIIGLCFVNNNKFSSRKNEYQYF